MIVSRSRSGGRGSGQAAPCGPARDCGCGCGGHGTREVPGACQCSGPERVGVPCIERPVYSAGQLLTADALRLGQRYLEERFALRRYVDGVGVVCGMHVRCDPERPGWIVVEPGYAVDCTGDDLVLCEPVRMDLCSAIAHCFPPKDPCGPKSEGGDVSPLELDLVGPGDDYTEDRERGMVRGRVTGTGGSPLPDARVSLQGTNWFAVTDQNGYYSFPAVAPGRYLVMAWPQGARAAQRWATVAASRVTMANFPLPEESRGERPGETSRRFSTYVLRAEAGWEGREPVPVVTQRGACDSRTECRPSRERTSVRLCVELLKEDNDARRADERTSRFRALGTRLFERLDVALVAAGDNESRQALAVADVLLRAMQDEPPRSLCHLTDVLCEVRRILNGQPPRCPLPQEITENPVAFVAAVMAHLVDDRREDYLTLPCDDCCERTGVRLAHIVIDERLAGCGEARCAIAGIDTHSPGREVLHPRSDWWRSDRVSLYDAYFRGSAEAGVLLSARGLGVSERDAAESPYTPQLPRLLGGWLEALRPGEWRRLGVHQNSDLYAPYGSAVMLWTVGGRVIAIEVTEYTTDDSRFQMRRYIQRVFHPTQPSGMETEAVGTSEAAERSVNAVDTSTSARRITVANDVHPAPFSEAINGVGEKMEAHLYRAGIRTFAALADTNYDSLRAALDPRVPLAREAVEAVRRQARAIAGGEHEFSAEDLERWSVEAQRRYERAEATAERKEA